MSTEPQMSFKQDSTVWVWDSTWFPAVVVHCARMGSLLVRLEHGVTFSATMADLVPRDPCGSSKPHPRARKRGRLGMLRQSSSAVDFGSEK